MKIDRDSALIESLIVVGTYTRCIIYYRRSLLLLLTFSMFVPPYLIMLKEFYIYLYLMMCNNMFSFQCL